MAEKNYTLRTRIEITGEKEYKESLKNISEAMKSASSEQALLDAQVQQGGRTMETDMRQRDILAKKLDLQKDKVEAVRKQLEKSKAETGENSEQTQRLTKELNYAEAGLVKAQKALEDFDDELKSTTGLDRFRQRFEQLKKETPDFIESMDKLGASLTKAVSVPLAGLATVAVKSFLDLEKEIYTVATVADTSKRSIDALTKDAIDASNRSGEAAAEVAQGMYQSISSGVDEAMAGEFTGLAAMAAKAGLTDVTTAVNGATSAINAWSIGYENAEDVFNKFIIAQNKGKTTFGEIASSIGQVTGVAPQVGVSLEEILSATAALTKNGVQTSQAMTGLKAVMSAVVKPSTQAAGAAKTLGLDFSVAALQSKGLTGFLADVMDKTQGDSTLLSELFGSVEGLSQVMLLGGAAATDYADALNEMGKSAGALQSAFDTITSSNAEKFSMSLNRVKNSGIALGQTFSPVIGTLADNFENATEWLSKLSDEQIQSIANWGLAVAAIGPVTSVFAKLYKGISTVRTALQALSVTGGGLTLGLAAVAAMTAGVIALKKHLDSLSKEATIKAAFGDITLTDDNIQAAVDTAAQTVYELNINTQGKLEFAATGDNVADSITQYFTRKKSPSSAEQESFKQSVADWVSPLIAKGSEAMDEETQALSVELDKAADAYMRYALQLATSSTDPTQAQLDKLEELKERIVEIGKAISDATNEAMIASKASYNLVSIGQGKSEDYALASAYVVGMGNEKKEEAKASYSPRLTAARSAFNTAVELGDEAGIAEKTALLAQAESDYAQAMADAEKYQTDLANQLTAGIYAQHEGQQESVRRIADLQHLYEQVLKLSETDTETDAGLRQWQKDVAALYAQVMGESFSGDQYGKAIVDMGDELQGRLADEIKGADVQDLVSAFSLLLQTGVMDGAKDADLSQATQDLLTVLDLTDDGKTLAEQIILGEKEALETDTTANDAMIQHALGIIDSAKGAYGIHSPSKEFEEIAKMNMQGEALGYTTYAPTVLSALSRHTAMIREKLRVELYAAGQAAGGALVSGLLSQSSAYAQALMGMTSASGATGAQTQTAQSATKSAAQSVTVNYTGSVSYRDSQRLSQQLALLLR